MRKLLAAGGAAALALWALAASADDITGTISNIDLTRNTFQLEGKTYTASPTNTVGVKLSSLKEGDRVQHPSRGHLERERAVQRHDAQEGRVGRARSGERSGCSAVPFECAPAPTIAGGPGDTESAPKCCGLEPRTAGRDPSRPQGRGSIGQR